MGVASRLNEGPRLQRKHKDETIVTPDKDAMASYANPMPGGYKFAPLVLDVDDQ